MAEKTQGKVTFDGSVENETLPKFRWQARDDAGVFFGIASATKTAHLYYQDDGKKKTYWKFEMDKDDEPNGWFAWTPTSDTTAPILPAAFSGKKGSFSFTGHIHYVDTISGADVWYTDILHVHAVAVPAEP